MLSQLNLRRMHASPINGRGEHDLDSVETTCRMNLSTTTRSILLVTLTMMLISTTGLYRR